MFEKWPCDWFIIFYDIIRYDTDASLCEHNLTVVVVRGRADLNYFIYSYVVKSSGSQPSCQGPLQRVTR